MNNRLIPDADADFANFVSNLGTKLTPMVTTFGLVAADAAAVTSDAVGMQTAVMDQVSKITAARGSTEAKNLTRAAAEKRVRALIGRIKKHPAYTQALGEQLGIVAGQVQPAKALASATSDLRPELRGMISGDGLAVVKFAKKGYTGIVLYCRRGGAGAGAGAGAPFELLGKQLTSPWVDTRPNLKAGEPETREYRAIYLDNDQTAGQTSGILVLTVPAGLQTGDTAAAPTLTPQAPVPLAQVPLAQAA